MSNIKSNFGPLVTTAWLEENLYSNDLVVLDAAWHMPDSGRSGYAEHQNCNIQNAQFFGIDEIADTTSDLPHMMPSEAKFAQIIGQMGINNDSKIVIYDSIGIFSAPRVWWMFRHMGHENVAVLDGGLKKWLAEGRKTSSDTTKPLTQKYNAKAVKSLVKSFDEILANVETKEAQIIDARGAPRFMGEAPEPRAGLKSGHIKGSLNLPFANLINPDGTMIGDEAIKAEFAKIGVDLDLPIITTCGSGVTACILALALAKLGKIDVPIYDGSWSEWGAIDDAPIE